MITTPSHTAFDALDLLLALAVAPLHPLAAVLVGAQWFLRRSPRVCAWALDLAAQGGAHIRADRPLVRRLLPGLVAAELALPAPPRALPGSVGWDDTDADDPLLLDAPARPALAPITVEELAASDNLLIVGSRGSGKTTLLQALIALRARRCYVLDPHSHPGKWPHEARVIGGGRDFAAIYAALLRAEQAMTERARQMSRQAGLHFAPFTLAGDEWGSVTSEITTTKGQDGPGRLLNRLLKEGRKFGVSFIGCAHGDTAESLGSKGDTAAFRNSFDWIVYGGAFVARQLKDQPDLVRDLPLGRTPEGGRFPLIVVAVSPVTGERRLLDLRGLDTISDPQDGAIRTPAELPWAMQESAAEPTPAARTPARTEPLPDAVPTPLVQADARTHPLPAAHPALPIAAPPPGSRDDLIRLLVAAGWGVTQIRDAVKGTYSDIGALVRQIEDAQLRAAAAPLPAPDDHTA
jgi:hypothetical protein